MFTKQVFFYMMQLPKTLHFRKEKSTDEKHSKVECLFCLEPTVIVMKNSIYCVTSKSRKARCFEAVKSFLAKMLETEAVAEWLIPHELEADTFAYFENNLIYRTTYKR